MSSAPASMAAPSSSSASSQSPKSPSTGLLTPPLSQHSSDNGALFAAHAHQGIILPGTFKSMLHNNTTGDIAILLPADYASLNDLVGLEDFPARVQLTYRSQSLPQPQDSQPSRRAVFACRGKFVVSTTANKTPSGHESRIRHYDMMLVQDHFEPGKPHFSVTFSKTLVQPSDHGDSGANGDRHLFAGEGKDKGVMLSGHYTTLRNYDLGTVRVHLSSGMLYGDLAPHSMLQGMQSPSMQAHSGPPSSNSSYANAASLHSPAPRRATFSVQFRPIDENGEPEQSWHQHDSFHSLDERLMRDTRPVSQSLSSVSSSHSHHGGHHDQHHQVQHQQHQQHHQHGHHHGGHQHHHGHHHGGHQHHRSSRFCYGCGETGHLHKDCPRDQLFCYNCNQTGHSSKNCKKPKPWEQAAMASTVDYQQQHANTMSHHHPQHQGHHHQPQQQLPTPYSSPVKNDPWQMQGMHEALPANAMRFGTGRRSDAALQGIRYANNNNGKGHRQSMTPPMTPPLSGFASASDPIVSQAHVNSPGTIGSPAQSLLLGPSMHEKKHRATISGSSPRMPAYAHEQGEGEDSHIGALLSGSMGQYSPWFK